MIDYYLILKYFIFQYLNININYFSIGINNVLTASIKMILPNKIPMEHCNHSGAFSCIFLIKGCTAFIKPTLNAPKIRLESREIRHS